MPKTDTFHHACEADDADKLRALVTAGEDINSRDAGQNTGLHIASYKGSTAAAKAMIELGCDVNAVNENKDTALHLAALSNSADIARVLVDAGVKIDLGDAQGYRAVHYACGEGSLEVASYLISTAMADLTQVNTDGLTPLMCAVQQGHLDAIKMILGRAPDHGLEVRNRTSDTALHYAAISGKGVESAKLLLAAGARFDALNKEGRTPVQESKVEKQMDFHDYFQPLEAKIIAILDRCNTPAEAGAKISELFLGQGIADSPSIVAAPKQPAPAQAGTQQVLTSKPLFSSVKASMRTKTTVEKLKEERAQGVGTQASSAAKKPNARIFQPSGGMMGF